MATLKKLQKSEVVVQSDITGLKHHELTLITHNSNMFYVYVDDVVGLE